MSKYLIDNDIEYFIDSNLEKFTTMRLRVNGDIAIVSSLKALTLLIKFLVERKINYHLVGWGANQVIHNTNNTLFIKLNFNFDREYLKESKDEYVLPASVSLNLLTSHAQKFGLKGWEVFTGIPASLGGAIFMNAGTALGEIGNLVKNVKILQVDGSIRSYNVGKNSFSYRKNHFVKTGEVIVEATLYHLGLDEGIKSKIKDYLDYRKTSQPLNTKNCGCVFKNFDQKRKAGQFIDSIGLKGLGLKGLKVSQKHANFIENFDEGSSEDFLKLVDVIKYELEAFAGIKFELEAKVY